MNKKLPIFIILILAILSIASTLKIASDFQANKYEAIAADDTTVNVTIDGATGAVTAISFVGDGSGLTCLPSGDFSGDNFEIVVTDGSGALTTSPVVNQNYDLTLLSGTGKITMTSGDGSFFELGCSITMTAPAGDVTLKNTSVTDNILVLLGTTTNATHFGVHDSAGGKLMCVFGNGRVGLGTDSPNAPFDLRADTPGTVGGFASGALQITSPSCLINANAVITGHNSFGGNKQLWYFGSAASGNDDIIVLNRQNGDLSLATNNITRVVIESTGQLRVLENIEANKAIDFTPLSSVSQVEGRVYYDDEDKALSLKTDISGSTQSLGQEFWIRVINKTGISISDGSIVYISGFDVTSGRPTVALAKADDEATANVVGFTTNTMADDAEGFVTAMGFLNDLDTSSFSAGDELFLSDTTAGEATATKPLIAVPVGFATKINATTGQILATISRRDVDSPMFAQLSDSVSQKPTVTTPVPITFNTNDEFRGVTHSITNATEDIIIDFDGTYTIFAQPQVERVSGCSGSFHMWARIGSDDKGTTASVSVANPSVITTTVAHNMSSSQIVEISNTVTTPSINAEHTITVTGASTFTIPVNVTSVTDGTGDWRRILDVNDDLANSNVEISFMGCNTTGVLPLIFTRDFTKGEKINIIQSISGTGQGLGIVASSPSGEPAIPSIIFTINKN